MDRLPFLDLAKQRVVVLDGAMGATLQTFPLDLKRDWCGQENISEVLNLTRPDVIQEIHEGFLAVGCDAVETNTFGGSKIVLAEAGLADRTFEINRIAAQIARRACDHFETPDRPRYVVGSVGPGTKIVTLGQTTWDVMEESFYRADARPDPGRRRCPSDRNPAGFAGHQMRHRRRQPRVCRSRPPNVPIMVQASFDQQNGGRNAHGLRSLRPRRGDRSRSTRVDVLGLNCAFGPFELTEIDPLHLRKLAALGQRPAQRRPAGHGRRQSRISR